MKGASASESQALQEAREAQERQFIGDILADDNSDYGQEQSKPVSHQSVSNVNSSSCNQSNKIVGGTQSATSSKEVDVGGPLQPTPSSPFVNLNAPNTVNSDSKNLKEESNKGASGLLSQSSDELSENSFKLINQ